MEPIKDVGEIVIRGDLDRIWRIPNFYDLPQEYNTVIRSPRFHCNDRDWYMEVYPDGRRLYSSSGWFGISVVNFNADYNLSVVLLGIIETAKECKFIISEKESDGDGSYCCARFLPRLLLQSWKEIFAQGGDLCLYFSSTHSNKNGDKLLIHFATKDAQEFFKQLYENPSIEPSIRQKEENGIPLETTIGEIHFDLFGDVVVWTIPNFWDLSQEYDAVIKSPRFYFKGGDWYMEVYPNGHRTYSSLGWFGINAWNLSLNSGVRNVKVSVSEENSNIHCLAFKTSPCDNGSYRCTRLLPTSLLKSWKDVIAPRGSLRLSMDINRADRWKNSQGMTVSTKYVEKWYKQKLENKDTFIESSTQTEGEIRLEKLAQDFREILLNGNISDVTLKVKGQEFKAHKSILAARSPVFLAMMTHETKEKISGVVDIPDVDPDIFPDFLNYLYSGSVENLTSENAGKLYTIADKYQVNELKESCKNLMLANFSIDSFCDVFTLSLQHNEKELKDACIQFFAEHSLDIVSTCKWKTFLNENPITGNELYIKQLELSRR